MSSLVERMQDGTIDAEPAVVFSNVADAPGLARASAMGVATETIPSKAFRKRRAEHEQQVIDLLRSYDVDLVCLAGYMRLLSPTMVEAFRDRILNIHPSLLPVFPGLHAQRQALEYGVRVSGCTVHVVDEQCDHGPIIMQAAVPVMDDDTEDALSARILEQEHKIYPEAVRLWCAGRIKIDGRHARIAAGAT